MLGAGLSVRRASLPREEDPGGQGEPWTRRRSPPWSAGWPGPRTRRRCSSTWPSIRTPTCSSTTSSSTRRELPGLGEVTSYGVVTQVSARHEGASFGSDVFLISDGVLPAQVQEIAEIATTRVEPECYVPPRPGAVVQRAVGEDRAQALYFDKMTRQVPVGLGRDGEPVYLNMDFLDGTRGAHVSISGVSGVATKTSFALFLLHSIFRGGALPNAHNAKALVFSVKGEDLLFLDTPNRRLDETAQGRVRQARPARRALRLRRLLRPADAVGHHREALRHRPDLRRRRLLVDHRGVLRAATCCPTSSPTPRTSATSTRWSSTRSRTGCGSTAPPRARTAPRTSTASCAAPTPSWSTSSASASPTRKPARAGRARSPARARSTRSSAACGPASARSTASSAATSPTTPRASCPRRTSRSPSWTSTTSSSARSGSSSASRSPPRPRARKRPARAACCSPCWTS